MGEAEQTGMGYMTPIQATLKQYGNHCSKNNRVNEVLCKYRVGNNYSAWTSLLNPKLIHPTASLTYLPGCLTGISYVTCLKQSCWTRQHIWPSYFTHLTEQLHYFSNRSGQKLKSSFTPFSHTSHPILQQILSLYLTSLKHIQHLTNSQHYCHHSGISQCYHHFPGKQLLPKRSLCFFPSPRLSD